MCGRMIDNSRVSIEKETEENRSELYEDESYRRHYHQDLYFEISAIHSLNSFYELVKVQEKISQIHFEFFLKFQQASK